MRMRYLVIAMAIILLQAATVTAIAKPAAKSVCDRACLENYVDRYLEAMAANDPSLDLFARNCRFTENGVELPLGGEGLWYSMSGRGTYKFYVPDVETRQVAYIGSVHVHMHVHRTVRNEHLCAFRTASYEKSRSLHSQRCVLRAYSVLTPVGHFLGTGEQFP